LAGPVLVLAPVEYIALYGFSGELMKSFRCLVSLAAAIIIVSWPNSFELNTFTALLAAVLIHEMGHIAAIYAVGMRIQRMALEPCGLRIEYGGDVEWKNEIVLTLAGPVFGMLYFFLCKNFCAAPVMSANLSLVYSAFNLLPVYPLDGGRIFSVWAENYLGLGKAESLCGFISNGICGALLLFGLIYFLKGNGGALLSAGLWLLIMQNGN